MTISPKSPKKILHVITGLGDGGAEGVLYRLCLSSREWQHAVISLTSMGKYGDLLDRAGITVYTLEIRNFLSLISGIFGLRRIVKIEKPNLVQTWMYHADLFGGVVAKVCAGVNVAWNIRHSSLKRGIAKGRTIAIAKSCAWLSHIIPDKIICCANKAKSVHENMGYRVEKMLVIDNGFDVQTFKPDKSTRSILRSSWGFKESDFVLGMVARWSPQKDHRNLLRALSLARDEGCDFACMLVGNGLEQNNDDLNRLITRYSLGDRIKLIGPQKNIAAVMNALDVHVLSSSSGEGFPNVVAEGMCCGTPSIVTDVGDSRRIVGNTGWVVPPDNPNALVTAIVEARAEFQSIRWQSYRAKAVARASQHFSIDKMRSEYEAVWNQLIQVERGVETPLV